MTAMIESPCDLCSVFVWNLRDIRKKVNSNLVCEGNEKYFTFEIQDGTNPLRFQIYSPKSLKGKSNVTMAIKTSNSTNHLSCS